MKIARKRRVVVVEVVYEVGIKLGEGRFGERRGDVIASRVLDRYNSRVGVGALSL